MSIAHTKGSPKMLTELALQFNCVCGIPPLPAACQVLIKCILLLRFPGAINLKCCRRMSSSSSSSAPHPSCTACHPHIAGILHKTCICRGASTWSTHCESNCSRRRQLRDLLYVNCCSLNCLGKCLKRQKGSKGCRRGGGRGLCAHR